MQETWVHSLSWENPLEKAVDPVFLPGEPVNRGAWRVQPVGLQSQTGLKRQQQQYKIKNLKKLSFMKPVPSAKRLGIADLTIISKLNIHPGVTCTSAVGSG